MRTNERSERPSGPFKMRLSRLETGPQSLATFIHLYRLLRSLSSQHSALVRSLHSLPRFTGSLTHFAHFLMGQLKSMNLCSRCNRDSRALSRFLSSVETRPMMFLYLVAKPTILMFSLAFIKKLIKVLLAEY